MSLMPSLPRVRNVSKKGVVQKYYVQSRERESEAFPINSSLFWQEHLGEERENESSFLLEG